MTNLELCQMLEARAKDRGREYGLSDGKLVVLLHGKNLYFALQFSNNLNTFMIRFFKGSRYAIFKLTSIDPSFEDFKKALIAKMKEKQLDLIPYSEIDIPKAIKNKVSATLIMAFKTKGMGIDMISLSFASRMVLVNPEETYESIAIDNDLKCFMSCDLFSL